MSENKPKIDLKSRLGRVSKSGRPPSSSKAPGAVPPPSAGLAPPPGMLAGGTPVPFPGQAPRPQGPTLNKDEPFQAVAAESMAPRAQEIKVEIGHDVVQQQKKGFIKIVVAAAIFSVVGIAIGWAVGSMSEKRRVAHQGVESAHELAKEVSATGEQVKTLKEKLDAAVKAMQRDKKFPAELSKDLAAADISFSAQSLAGKNTSMFKGALSKGLVDFARDSQDLATRKDVLRKLLDSKRDLLKELVEKGAGRQVQYGVFVQKEKNGAPIAIFSRLAKPFSQDDSAWADELGLRVGTEVVDSKRYKSDEPFMKPAARQGDKPTIFTIPIQPESVAASFPDRFGQKMEEELKAITILINGASGTGNPDDDKPGLINTSDDLLRQLKEIGAK